VEVGTLVETAFSIALLGCFIWGVRFLLPKAIKERDSMALTCAVLVTVLSLFAWLLLGPPTRSVVF
jgi:hypothetical protein